ncbi:hypothetical protein C8Q77DRAFT_1109927 [Trametes polyzona]|nr:hypothetical protein C8Q77DRAFT_1109927 [Trametes polyzona]
MELTQWPPITLGWLQNDERERYATYRARLKSTVPPPPNATREDYDKALEEYADQGVALLRRFKTSTSAANRIAALLPTWDWESGSVSIAAPLELPCVLAYAANDVLASQPWDGNLGLAFPKSNKIFNAQEPSVSATSM